MTQATKIGNKGNKKQEHTQIYVENPRRETKKPWTEEKIPLIQKFYKEERRITLKP